MEIGTALEKRAKLERFAAIKNERLKLVQFPSGELTMKGLNTYIDNLEYYEDFIPSVIITDFADKFRAETWKSEHRHGLNEIWEGHKALAQKRHCFVGTGSQSSAAREGRDTKRGDWADDIRKLTLLDAGLIINQTEIEKDWNIYRCGVAKQRHEEFTLMAEIMVLNQLRIGRPYIDSCMMY